MRVFSIRENAYSIEAISRRVRLAHNGNRQSRRDVCSADECLVNRDEFLRSIFCRVWHHDDPSDADRSQVIVASDADKVDKALAEGRRRVGLSLIGRTE